MRFPGFSAELSLCMAQDCRHIASKIGYKTEAIQLAQLLSEDLMKPKERCFDGIFCYIPFPDICGKEVCIPVIGGEPICYTIPCQKVCKRVNYCLPV